jgi:hypothetical protein
MIEEAGDVADKRRHPEERQPGGGHRSLADVNRSCNASAVLWEHR